MALPRVPTPEDIETARSIVDLRDHGDELIANGRFLLSMADNPVVRSNPDAADQFVQGSQKFTEAEALYIRTVGMVRAAVQNAVMQSPDEPLVKSAAQKWREVNGGLSGTGDQIPRTWTWQEIAVVALFMLAAGAFILAFGAFVAALGVLGGIIASLGALAATVFGGAVAIDIADVHKSGANIDAAAAGVKESPTISQLASQGLSTAKVLGIAGVIGLALWLFKGRKR